MATRTMFQVRDIEGAGTRVVDVEKSYDATDIVIHAASSENDHIYTRVTQEDAQFLATKLLELCGEAKPLPQIGTVTVTGTKGDGVEAWDADDNEICIRVWDDEDSTESVALMTRDTALQFHKQLGLMLGA